MLGAFFAATDMALVTAVCPIRRASLAIEDFAKMTDRQAVSGEVALQR